MTVTPDFWPDLRAFVLFVTPALLILATIRAVALWNDRHNDEEN